MTATHKHVDFHLSNGKDYILDRGHLASARLSLQHYLWKTVFGFNIHPSITLPAKPVIADVGMGNGFWATEVAAEKPDAEIHGFDIDLTQTSPEGWLPASISLHQWNVHEEIPSGFVGKFDFVHMRLMVLTLSEIDRKEVLARFLSLLKPGGWIQWDELDCVNMEVKKTHPSHDTLAMDKLRAISHSRGRHDWALELPGMLEEAGFVGATIEHFDDPDSILRFTHDTNMMVYEEFSRGLVREGHEDEAQHVLELVEQANQEVHQGVSINNPRVVCTARRPSS